MAKLSEHGKTMEELKKLIAREKTCAKIIDETQDIWRTNLDAAIERTKEEFFVVVMGNFNAGKSTMINALIGDNVLPTFPLPTTAVMTELRYGEEKKIIMYPKKGENIEGKGDRPFTVPATADAIEKYITIDNEAGINVKPEDSVAIASKFEKMELYWPLEILKNGVVIVDSPGLNDPYSNDVIVKNYLPRADAIIYTMNSTNAYMKPDKDELENLNAFGIRNILFVYTYWDMTQASGERAVTKTRNYCVSNALKHTDLGSSCVHFLASRDGLHARIEKLDDLWIESGYAEFESYLQEYLTTRKGQDKVNNIVSTMESQAISMKKQAGILDENAKRDKVSIQKDIAMANEKLSGLKKDAKNIHSTFVLKLENKRSAVESTVKTGLRGLKGKVDLDGFTPTTEFRTGFKKLNPFGQKKIANAIAQEFSNEYKARLEKELLKYQSTTVYEELKSTVKYAAESIEDDVKVLAEQLDALDTSVGLPTIETDQKGEGSPLLGIAYGLLTGDWFTGSTIAVYGKAGRQLGFQFAAGAGLGVAAALGAPITLPMVALTAIAATVLGILTDNNEKKLEKIRRETVQQWEESCFEDSNDEFINATTKSIMERVDQIFDKVGDDVKEVISVTFTEKEKVFKAMLSQADLDSSQKDKLIKERKDAVENLTKVIDEAKVLQSNY